MKKILLSASIFCVAIFSANAQLPKNDFTSGLNIGENLEKGAYAGTSQGEAGEAIMANQWNLTGKTGSNNQDGVSPTVIAPLTYPGYVESGTSNAIQMARFESGARFSVYSLTNSSEYNEGTYYVAMMLNVEEVGSSNGADFFMLDGNYTGNNQRIKLFVKNSSESESTKFAFGISDDASTPNVVSGDYNRNETMLVVLKFNFDTTSDAIQLFVNPTMSNVEPAATIKMDRTSTLAVIRGLTIRQRSTTKIQIGGIRFADNWADALGLGGGSSITENNADNGAIVSTKYFNLSGMEVNEPAQGNVYIKKDIFENGSTATSKIVK